MKTVSVIIFVCIIAFSCQSPTIVTVDVEKCKAEILQAEKEFEKMVADKGIKEAFLYFASDSATINRSNLIYKGKSQMNLYFENVDMSEAQIKWTPDFVDVASSGDLGYTYGKYVYTQKDSTGKIIESKGIFHTVWKKQIDGNWKFVWD